MAAPRSLVLITVDCLRADHVGFMGYPGRTTPFLDSLAPQSLIFRNAVAAGTPTYYSLPAILASRYPLALGRETIGIAPGESTLASVLSDCGFQTAAFLAANPYLSPRFGYDIGFAQFNDFLQEDDFSSPAPPDNPSENTLRSRANRQFANFCHAAGPLGRAYDEIYFQYCQKVNGREACSLDSLRKFPAADIIVDRAISWLNQNSHRPLFLWLHFMDPHAPYIPKQAALEEMGCRETDAAQTQYLNAWWARADLDSRRLQKKREQVIALYDAGIRWMDGQVRRLSEALVDLNLWSNCTLAVTADHGEEFLDHGGRFHAPVKLNQETIHVPLLLRIANFTRARFVDQPISLLDLPPTLLDSLGIPSPADFRGRSCWRDLIAGRSWDRPLITESIRGCTNPFRMQTRNAPRMLAVRRGAHKLVLDFATGKEDLFNLALDSEERSPLPHDCGLEVRRDLLACARKHIAEARSSKNVERCIAAQLSEFRTEWTVARGVAN